MARMTIDLATPDLHDLGAVVRVLGEWQDDEAAFQLHPGDLGWFWRFGGESTAAAVRTWSRDSEVVAIGLLDGPGLLRLTVAPSARADAELAERLTADLTDPDAGVLGPGEADVEAPMGIRLQDALTEAGWATEESWTPLRRSLSEPIADSGLRVEQVGPEQAPVWASVMEAAFDGATAAEERWHAMVTGPAYDDARSLVGYDEHGAAVAGIAVWSAGPGRPGVIEPMGVHRDHRGRGHGRSITLAGAAALREMGASSITVATPASNLGAVATYVSAGLDPLPERRDRRRGA